MIDVVAVAEASDGSGASVPKAQAETQEPEIPEASEPMQASVPTAHEITETEEPPKRKPGRPKKVVEAREARVPKAQEVPQEPKTPRVKPPPKPKAKTRVPKENKAAPSRSEVPIQLPEAPAPFQGLSSAELVAELVNRRRIEERAMKATLYRSFVM